MFLRRFITPLLLTASVLFSGLIGVTHVHSHRAESGHSCGPTEHSGITNFGSPSNASDSECCFPISDITNHQPSKPESTPCDHQRDDDCQLCNLLASFVTTLPPSTNIVFDSSVCGVSVVAPVRIAIETPLRVRGRAPPIV